MVSDVVKVLVDGIEQLFGDNYLDLILFLILLLLSIWLYREFRKKFLENEKHRNEQVYNLLKSLTELEFELKDYLSNKSNFISLKEKLINSIPYLSFSLSKKISDFHENMDDETIKDFLEELKKEKKSFKYNQNDSISHVNENSVWRIIEYHYKTKFEAILNPLMMTVITLFIFFFFLLIFLALSGTGSFWGKLNLVLQIVNSIIFVVFLIIILDLLSNRKIIKNWKTWAFLIVFFCFSILLLMFLSNYEYLPVILTIFYILSIFLILPRIIKKEDKN